MVGSPSHSAGCPYLSGMLRKLLPCLFLFTSCMESRVRYDALSMDPSIAADSLAEARIRPYRDSITVLLDSILVRSDTLLVRGRPDSPLGSLVADLILEEARRETRSGMPVPDLCLLNIGGLRIDLPAGDITVNRVFELMPFENAVTLIRLDEQGVRALTEHIITVGGQPVSGLSIHVRDSMTTEIRVNGKELTDRTYLVATSDYLADGGDRMTFFKKSLGRTDLDLKIRDAIMRHFARAGLQGKTISAPTDRRIILAP